MVQRLVRQSIVGLAIMLVLLFVPAGTLAWPAAWIFLLEFSLASVLITRWLLRHNPDLLVERMKPLIQREQKPWDKRLMAVFLFLWCAWFVVIALDAVRFGWVGRAALDTGVRRPRDRGVHVHNVPGHAHQ